MFNQHSNRLENMFNEHSRRMEEMFRKQEEKINILSEDIKRLYEKFGIRYDIGDYNDIDNNNYDNLIESKINVNKLNENNKTCVICYDDFKDNDDVIFLPCFHVFHTKCIKEWLKNKNFCPLCKSNVKNNLNN